MVPKTPLCEMCDRSGEMRCSRCKQARYCSEGCQRKDLDKHRFPCRTAPNFTNKNRPFADGPDRVSRRAIYFDPAENRPQWVWVEVKLCEVGGPGILYWLPTLEPFGMTGHTAAVEYIPTNKRTGRQLLSTIFVPYLDDFLSDGSIKNEVADAMVGGGGAARSLTDWRGPMLFHGMEDIDYEPRVPSRDLEASDLRHIVDWLLSRRSGQIPEFGAGDIMIEL